ncbi:hypothetical protein DFH09DRAFT_108005 [Mycena vulgaris]|nr:hypothetical protein DFH09DRAFT_108005 [Mycena vulgaris]
MARNVTYDDRDSAILNYSPGWFRAGTYNATSVNQTGTLASSKVTNVNVTFVFPTPATEFFYYGIKRCCGGSYLICIDCDPNNRQFVPINAVDTTDDGQRPPVVLFSKKFPVADVHEVILMNQPDLAFGGNSEITLDRFELTIPDDPAAVEAASSSTIPNFVSTPTSSGSVTVSTARAGSSSAYLAPILGGVLGGLATLLVIVGIWLLLRRRSRRLAHNLEAASDHQAQSFWRPNSTLTTSIVPAATISTPTSRRELDAGRLESYPDSTDDDLLPPEYGEVFPGQLSTQPRPEQLRPWPKARR